MPDLQEQFKNINRTVYFERKIMEFSDAIVLAFVGLDNIQAAKRPEDKDRLVQEIRNAMNLVLD